MTTATSAMMETVTTAGFVTFRIGEREFATSLDDVREIVRLEGLSPLPGMAAHMAGVVELRGAPLPVMDLRAGGQVGEDKGDVVVLATADGTPMGVAVDSVVAVRAEGELVAATDASTAGLPDYVVEVLRETATGTPVLRVDIHRMLEALS
jgi:purine-binding chemotaxis protein CheW